MAFHHPKCLDRFIRNDLPEVGKLPLAYRLVHMH
jgi:hypothetical protein